MKIACIFEKDPANPKYRIPKIKEEFRWVLQDTGSLMTIKIDGIAVRVTSPVDGQWKIAKRMTDGSFMPLAMEDFPEVWEAWDNLAYKTDGMYVVYGPKIKGNPQNTTKHLMIKTFPVDSKLIVNRADVKIKRFATITDQEFYNSVVKELSESNVEGLVFHKEGPGMKLISVCQITRRQLGFIWPKQLNAEIIEASNNQVLPA